MKAKQNNRFSAVATAAALFFASLIVACGKQVATDDTTTDVTATSKIASSAVPVGSTGTASPIALQFSAATAAATALSLQSTTLDLGNGIVVEDARMNIGRIKLKGSKEESDDEKELKNELKAKEQEEDENDDGDKAGEQELEASKKSYEALKEAATSDAEKDQIEADQEAAEKAIEETIAIAKAAKEAKVEALEDKSDDSLKWGGPYVYNAVTKVVAPEIPETSVLDGGYARIEFKLKPSRSTTDNADMLNQSVHVSGTVVINSVAVPFLLTMRSELEFKLKGTGALQVDAGVANKLQIAFDLSTWFTGIDLSIATRDAMGVIQLNETDNSEIQHAIMKLMKKSTKFGEDKDGDGELGDDEDEGDGGDQVQEEEDSE